MLLNGTRILLHSHNKFLEIKNILKLLKFNFKHFILIIRTEYLTNDYFYYCFYRPFLRANPVRYTKFSFCLTISHTSVRNSFSNRIIRKNLLHHLIIMHGKQWLILFISIFTNFKFYFMKWLVPRSRSQMHVLANPLSLIPLLLEPCKPLNRNYIVKYAILCFKWA